MSGVAWGMLRAMRPHQWAKNLLLAVPLMLSHQVDRANLLAAVACAIVAFSLAASGIYVLNDLCDLDADRHHPTKRNRPFASGRVPLRNGVAMAVLLPVVGVGVALLVLPLKFAGMLGLYLALSTTYTLYWKRVLLLDVFVLAGLYALRILSGGAATGVVVSPWLLAFSMFFFTSLAFAKRYAELKLVKLGEDTEAKGRDYGVGDMEMFKSVGPASGYMAVLVFALYVNSDAVVKLYRHPQALWLACPLLMYWITRVWFLVERHMLPDDPVLFALRDRVSWVVGALTLLVVILATL